MRIKFALVAVALFSLTTMRRARADFVENFDLPDAAGRVFYRGDATYLADGVMGGSNKGNVDFLNGYVIPTTADDNFPQNFGLIEKDESGDGLFLYSGTRNNAQDPMPHNYAGVVWRNLEEVPIKPNSTYTFAFYLTNSADHSNDARGGNAIIRTRINGDVIGGPHEAVGSYEQGDQWQRVAVVWESGESTKADLALVNEQATGRGNDFGIDSISFLRHSADFDGDGDGDVDGGDFLIWQRALGTTAATGRVIGDANHDLKVDALDLEVWRRQIGSTTSADPLPEPYTLSMLAVGAWLPFASRRHMRRR